MSPLMLASVKAGLASFVLYAGVFGIGMGFIFLFLPTFPIFLVGLQYGPRCARDAVIIACVCVSLLAGIPATLMFALLFALPSAYICKHALPNLEGYRMRRDAEGITRIDWPSIGGIMLDLSLMGCGMIALASAYYWQAEGGLPAYIAAGVENSFPKDDPQYTGMVREFVLRWSFLIFPITIWLWALMLYVHAWAAHKLLKRTSIALRPDLSIQPFSLPSWLLSLLVICSLAALIGSEPMRFLGRSCLLVLMLPYFFAGIAWLRVHSKSWPQSGLFLFFIYFMVFTQFWPALILSAIGLWQQIKSLSAGKT